MATIALPGTETVLPDTADAPVQAIVGPDGDAGVSFPAAGRASRSRRALRPRASSVLRDTNESG